MARGLSVPFTSRLEFESPLFIFYCVAYWKRAISHKESQTGSTPVHATCAVEKLVSQWAHNPKIAGSSPAPATKLRINYSKSARFETSDWVWCIGAREPSLESRIKVRILFIQHQTLVVY